MKINIIINYLDSICPPALRDDPLPPNLHAVLTVRDFLAALAKLSPDAQAAALSLLSEFLPKLSDSDNPII